MIKRKNILKGKLSFWKVLRIVLTVNFWIAFVYILFFIDPIIWKSVYYLPFLLLFSFSVGLTLSILVKRLIICLVIALGIFSILLLRILGFKDIINPILIIGLVITLIYFFTASKENGNLKSNNLIKQSDI